MSDDTAGNLAAFPRGIAAEPMPGGSAVTGGAVPKAAVSGPEGTLIHLVNPPAGMLTSTSHDAAFCACLNVAVTGGRLHPGPDRRRLPHSARDPGPGRVAGRNGPRQPVGAAPYPGKPGVQRHRSRSRLD